MKYIIVTSSIDKYNRNSSLLISDLNYDDDGMYYCNANNTLFEFRHQNSTFSKFRVHCELVNNTNELYFDCVFFSDPPDLLSSFVDHIRNESDTLQLHCNFTGTPSPAVWWYRNVSGQFERLRHTGRFVITETKSEEERVTDSYLEVSNLVKSDEGTYRCLGVNNILNLINAEESDEAYITIYGKLAIEQQIIIIIFVNLQSRPLYTLLIGHIL